MKGSYVYKVHFNFAEVHIFEKEFVHIVIKKNGKIHEKAHLHSSQTKIRFQFSEVDIFIVFFKAKFKLKGKMHSSPPSLLSLPTSLSPPTLSISSQ